VSIPVLVSLLLQETIIKLVGHDLVISKSRAANYEIRVSFVFGALLGAWDFEYPVVVLCMVICSKYYFV
jgi:hypothetical protein